MVLKILQWKGRIKMESREVGVVKWFNAAKGFGFIAREGQDDVFVHFSAIQSEGFRRPCQRGLVDSSLEQTDKGLQASNVVLLIIIFSLH